MTQAYEFSVDIDLKLPFGNRRISGKELFLVLNVGLSLLFKATLINILKLFVFF